MIIVIMGVSGSGKSTLVNLIIGLFKPKKGSIKVDGQNIHNNLRSWQNKIGYVPQNIFLTDDTIKKNIAFALPEEKINNASINKAVLNAKLDGLFTANFFL